ncbi:hypothetical protein NKG05_15640 [Oerskovia sp. M15]
MVIPLGIGALSYAVAGVLAFFLPAAAAGRTGRTCGRPTPPTWAGSTARGTFGAPTRPHHVPPPAHRRLLLHHGHPMLRPCGSSASPSRCSSRRPSRRTCCSCWSASTCPNSGSGCSCSRERSAGSSGPRSWATQDPLRRGAGHGGREPRGSDRARRHGVRPYGAGGSGVLRGVVRVHLGVERAGHVAAPGSDPGHLLGRVHGTWRTLLWGPCRWARCWAGCSPGST